MQVGSLATRGLSAFIFNPSFPEAIALRKWCIANAEKINNLPATNLQRAAQKKPTADDIISIVDLPTSVTEPEYPTVQATVQVVDFNHNFYYLSCSNCNRATDAYGDGSFWCNYCDQKVPPLPRLKFNVEIADQTGSIPATVFAEKAEQLYDITAVEMVNNTTDGNLSVEMIQKLSTPKKWVLILKASMYTYGAITQCVFNVHSVFDTIPYRQASSQNLGPNTPKKRGAKAPSTADSPIPFV
ncbi:replication protein A 70 kDa DNA-binding subunit B-like [Rhododendron vialii]|uniref:replication protein A 70 kDa DNA-binding subunit B-like n=1 Tax=Rhododendron vialii TaxID=182163 RepID=UPI00265D84D9|nr:replication protein A 70 kDa DNA-binding subunit B-like [Rhododendron vialii]XP_058197277.1 replication protein A 70 kDa DNA-binding subunit B-like [Rhododendron vialii]XP_058197278.1 replication protein A 70 kDa DNA-binding subunit B-like [Rhododendron vialii]XP_058197279.1 replication protein A 70 kDa DNA-binding subunit B-like [Rhododendron vialii]XP_058197280.1 replication protein A 70 kDa DNA-binding subunit B-like [Rhododendron vialii]